ncbi:sulfite dehydrogenase (cytochrome) subunit SorA apoprotein [Glaciihabitans tibetensis]|uniref:Sulfite dehydrogenase (Cytochrome) subunit SorA apoprotein n=1 Tax=Glaciihabitans tibetensis TaxID=1266600 RepID=A0A2T0VA72_9MICO|nr:molybdopterin-dependent oxidoreductase [Glaciihabitans tibetensis]PRY66968.1 sulfite dehydrogenase (cytochrome) subunit SorA apoprotein [Glaciihabitans tibetensis]
MVELTTQDIGDLWVEGKHPDLEVLSPQPLVAATPIALMAGQRITTTDRIFIRNIQDFPEAHTVAARPIEGWEIELVGLMTPSRIVIQAEELLDMEQVEYEMVLQCSGNGRAMYPSIPGTPWNQGGVANVVFSGVPLSAVLEKHGVIIDPQVRYVTAEGREGAMGPELSDLEHSLPVADVLATSIIALRLNGEPLPGIHGGPVRLITPGFFGTMQLKWLARLRFEVSESTCFYHAVEYRVPLSPVKPGDDFEFTLDNSRPTWLIKLMSYVLEPAPHATVARGTVTVSGVAYNDGMARLEAVLVSVDRGETWQPTQFDTPDSPYAWYLWSTQVQLDPGEHEIWARAIDYLGRSQPLDGSVNWNPNGYEWTGVFKTPITVS